MKELVKYDTGKLPYNLLPFEALDEVVKVLDFGAKKYAPNGWRTASPSDVTRYEAALLRHMSRHMRGEFHDDETGLLHMAHIATNALFILSFMLRAEEDE